MYTTPTGEQQPYFAAAHTTYDPSQCYSTPPAYVPFEAAPMHGGVLPGGPSMVPTNGSDYSHPTMSLATRVNGENLAPCSNHSPTCQQYTLAHCTGAYSTPPHMFGAVVPTSAGQPSVGAHACGAHRFNGGNLFAALPSPHPPQHLPPPAATTNT